MNTVSNVLSLTHSKSAALYFAHRALMTLGLFDTGREQVTILGTKVKPGVSAEIKIIFGNIKLQGTCTIIYVHLVGVNKIDGTEIDPATTISSLNAAELDYKLKELMVEQRPGKHTLKQTIMWAPNQKQPHILEVK